MASAEMQLVCKIIKTGELKRVIEWGISVDDFLMLETKAIFQQLLATYTNPETSGSVIGPRLAQEKFTQLNLGDVDEHVSLEHLCQEVRDRRLAKELKENAQKAIEIADVRPLEALSIMQYAVGQALRLDSGKNTDIDFAVGMERFMKRYMEIKNGGVLGKYPWPWGPLQDETGGIQEDDFIVFYGRPKSMKSWVLCFLIAWAVDQSQRILVYTKEMTGDNIYMRLAACLACVPYSDVRKAKLTPEQEQHLWYWVEIAKSLVGQNRLIVLSAKDVAGRDTVSWLRSKVDKYAPTVVFIDGLYLMSPENQKLVKENERVASISRAVRQMILDTRVPVIATMQANRKAAGHDRAELDEIAFSDAISQDCTMAIRVINDKTSPTISLVFGGAREINFEGLRINGIPAVNFDCVSTLTAKDVEKAKKEDNPEEAAAKAKGREPRTLGQNKSQNGLSQDPNYKAALKNL